MMNGKIDRRCTDCVLKAKDCSDWDDKSEKTVSGWDKNRFAISCVQYKEQYDKD